MKKRIAAILAAAILTLSVAGCNPKSDGNSEASAASSVSAVSDSSKEGSSTPSGSAEKVTAIENWTEDSPAMKSIVAFVEEVTDEKSDKFVPAEKRIAVFDSDGTLYGELFPTYVDQCLMIHRLVHDDTYKGNPEDVTYCTELEKALINGTEKPKAPRSSGNIIADAFKGMTVEEYRAYIRKFLSQPVNGFENMTYADGYYKPMVSLIKYLSDNGFKVYINSGAEVNMLRELSMDTLGQWVPSYQVIGTRFGITSDGRPDDTKARDYTPGADEKIVFDGSVEFKNLKLNKVVSILNDLGTCPVLAFGNSSGDLAMGQYVMQHGGKAYMLLCDDLDRDHGDLDTAASFKADCDKMGIETVSMKNEFATIYGDFKLTPYTSSQTEESLAPAA